MWLLHLTESRTKLAGISKEDADDRVEWKLMTVVAQYQNFRRVDEGQEEEYIIR